MLVPIWLAREASERALEHDTLVTQQHLNRRRFSLRLHLSVANQFAMSPTSDRATSGQKTGQIVTKSGTQQDKIWPQWDKILS
ncbi:hypothetical protein Pan153_03750 [Gimesia panareensis]|uniref:Uncharacterized protein n=1 Tax=Gimesia panareensis TaxID=2527978 RepID=A0A518A071_9PLAN|nr:hypothetical protein Pan110_03930 [Gimesia panareensis]QDV15757.1 hypothetical protein Pan153_03750 [Gimesia panareensis]